MWKIFCFVLPAQNMLSVILTEVELRQMFWSTIGRWICWRTDVKFLTAGFQLSFRFPHPVTRPLKPSDIRLPEKIPVRYITRYKPHWTKVSLTTVLNSTLYWRSLCITLDFPRRQKESVGSEESFNPLQDNWRKENRYLCRNSYVTKFEDLTWFNQIVVYWGL